MAEATNANEFEATQRLAAQGLGLLREALDALPKQGAEYYRVRLGHVVTGCEKITREMSQRYGAPAIPTDEGSA